MRNEGLRRMLAGQHRPSRGIPHHPFHPRPGRTDCRM